MKTIKEHIIMKYLKHLFLLALLVSIGVACDDNPDEFPVNTDELLDSDNTGAFARVVDSEGSVWDLFAIQNGEEQQFTVTLEVDDAENGGQLESIEFTVGFADNEGQVIGDLAQGEVFRSFEASEFEVNSESGLPRITTTFTSSELISQLGIDSDDLGINAAFALRWTLNTTTGKSFNSENSGLNITGGAFFSSPFAQNITLSLEIPEDLFVGDYQFTQDAQATAGVIGGFGDGWLFGADATGIVTLELDPDNPLNGRTFTTEEEGYLDGFFGPRPGTIDPITFAFTIDPLTTANITTMTNNPEVSVTFSGTPILLGAPDDASLQGTWDSSDDGTFTLTIVDDVNAASGSSNPISFTFVKQ